MIFDILSNCEELVQQKKVVYNCNGDSQQYNVGELKCIFDMIQSVTRP